MQWSLITDQLSNLILIISVSCALYRICTKKTHSSSLSSSTEQVAEAERTTSPRSMVSKEKFWNLFGRLPWIDCWMVVLRIPSTYSPMYGHICDIICTHTHSKLHWSVFATISKTNQYMISMPRKSHHYATTCMYFPHLTQCQYLLKPTEKSTSQDTSSRQWTEIMIEYCASFNSARL